MTENLPRIIDAKGQVIPPRGTKEFRQYAAMNGWNNGLAGGQGWGFGSQPYAAADRTGEAMALWNPILLSPDTELNYSRDIIVARARDLVRNDGWASGAVTRILDNAIGANFRPIFRPDYRALRAMTGNKSFDATWAHEFGKQADAYFRTWANDPGKWCDIERGLTFSQLCYVAFRHELIDGDSLAVARFEPGRVRPGRARYATAVQLVDPDRLSNPNNVFDMKDMRGGVKIDDDGAAVGYYIREAHQGDWYNAAKSVTWQLIPRETRYGRPVVVHNFPHDRASQHRGGNGILTPIMERLKMLVKYDRTEMTSAIINSIFAAYIESPFDHSTVQDAMGGGEEVSGGVASYQDGRIAFHEQTRTVLGGSRVPILYPGEKMNTVESTHPTSNFGEFEKNVLRNISQGTGLAPQQVSGNYADANYSSMRAALLEAWKTFDRRRANFATGFAHPIASCWMEESMDLDDYPLPNGVVPEFFEARYAYSWARWIGPARGWVDPVAEKQGEWLGLKMGVRSLEDVAAEQGQDLEETLDQQQMEIRMYEDRGMMPPDWSGAPTIEPSAIPSPPTVATKASPQGKPGTQPGQDQK